MSFDVVGLGLCAWDTVCLFDRYPGPNQKVEVISSATCGGGPVPTALAVFSRLGGKAAFLGVTGDDTQGEKLRRNLEEFGVDVSHVVVRPNHCTPCAYIWVDRQNGERTVALDSGDTDVIRIEELPETLIEETPFLLIDGRHAELCISAATLCRQNKGQVILDAGSPRSDIEQLLSVTDHAVVSRDFLRGTFPDLSGEEALDRIQAMGPPSVVATQGEKGGYWLEGRSRGRYSAFSVEVLDTTGAGDAFHGAYLYGLKQGRDMPQRCRYASAVAALVCRDLGGRAAAPTSDEVRSFLESSNSN